SGRAAPRPHRPPPHIVSEEKNMSRLSADEKDMVDLVATFVDERVRGRVRDFEASDTYPEEFVEEMKKLGVFGLLVPDEYGGVDVSAACFARITEELARGWM